MTSAGDCGDVRFCGFMDLQLEPNTTETSLHLRGDGFMEERVCRDRSPLRERDWEPETRRRPTGLHPREQRHHGESYFYSPHQSLPHLDHKQERSPSAPTGERQGHKRTADHLREERDDRSELHPSKRSKRSMD
ncbi:uncharacterized protein ACNS7B_009595 isoform 2-T2 [Menidia menidia]